VLRGCGRGGRGAKAKGGEGREGEDHTGDGLQGAPVDVAQGNHVEGSHLRHPEAHMLSPQRVASKQKPARYREPVTLDTEVTTARPRRKLFENALPELHDFLDPAPREGTTWVGRGPVMNARARRKGNTCRPSTAHEEASEVREVHPRFVRRLQLPRADSTLRIWSTSLEPGRPMQRRARRVVCATLMGVVVEAE